MFKKLLALSALAVVGVAANAEIVVDFEKDWSTATGWNNYVMGYIPEIKDEALWAQWPNYDYKKVSDVGEGEDYPIVSINGEDHYKVPCTTDDGLRDEWGIQFHLLGGNCDTEPGQVYTITVVAKSTKDGLNLGLPFSWGWGSGEGLSGSVALGTEYEEISFTYDSECLGNSCWVVAQIYGGDKVDDNGNPSQVWIKSVKITHDAQPKAPETWDNLLVNGDAEAEVDPENACAVMKNFRGDLSLEEVIEPAARVQEGDNWVYVQDAPAVDRSLFEEGDGSYSWKNQFWIVAPRTFATNESFRLSFKYKATVKHATPTQAHAAPGSYLHWACIGDVEFETEWKEFSKVITVSNEMNGMYSVAFNLSTNIEEPVKYYFDDIKWEVLRLEEGYFVAGDFNDWNYGEALKFDYDEDGGVYVKTVGNTEKPASEIKISTRKGQDAAFHTNALSVAAGDGIMEEEPCDFTVGNGKKIQLPEANSWIIEIDEEYGQITFYINPDDAVESVSVDNAAPVYYNLQGVKVNAPVKGQVVIVKRGDKVSKEIAR
ncbi:MAG: hypothetical protein K2N16_08730 [Muribaculaceae bacterium]|nr:hypothetical protein [Muribaculaceae bacterium]